MATSHIQALTARAAYLKTKVATFEREHLTLLREMAQLQGCPAHLIEDTARTRAEEELRESTKILCSRMELLMQDNLRLRQQNAQQANDQAQAHSRQLQQQRQLRGLWKHLKHLENENNQLRHYNCQYQADKQGLWEQLEACKADNANLEALLEAELAAAAASAGADTADSTADSRVRAVRAQLTLAQREWERERQKLSEGFQLAMQQLETSRSRNRQLEVMVRGYRAQTEDLKSGSGGSRHGSSSSDGSDDSSSNDDSQFSSSCCSSGSSGSSCSSSSLQATSEVCENAYPYDVVDRFYHGDGKHITSELDKVEAVPTPSPFMMAEHKQVVNFQQEALSINPPLAPSMARATLPETLTVPETNNMQQGQQQQQQQQQQQHGLEIEQAVDTLPREQLEPLRVMRDSDAAEAPGTPELVAGSFTECHTRVLQPIPEDCSSSSQGRRNKGLQAGRAVIKAAAAVINFMQHRRRAKT